MGIKTVPHYSPDLAPYDFCLFPKLRGYRYETIEEMKEAVTKVTDTLTKEDFHGALQKLLERYNKCVAAGGDYFEGDRVSYVSFFLSFFLSFNGISTLCMLFNAEAILLEEQ